MATYKGRCFCGAVEFNVTGEPAAMGYCHCESCRGWSAAPVNAFTLWKPDAVKVTRGVRGGGARAGGKRAVAAVIKIKFFPAPGKARGVVVPGSPRRHDGCVYHSQAMDAFYVQFLVPARAHAAGRGRMEHGLARL